MPCEGLTDGIKAVVLLCCTFRCINSPFDGINLPYTSRTKVGKWESTKRPAWKNSQSTGKTACTNLTGLILFFYFIFFSDHVSAKSTCLKCIQTIAVCWKQHFNIMHATCFNTSYFIQTASVSLIDEWKSIYFGPFVKLSGYFQCMQQSLI